MVQTNMTNNNNIKRPTIYELLNEFNASNSDELDLSNKGLQGVPLDIIRCLKIKTLNLDNNILSVISSVDLPYVLEILFAKYNRIVSISNLKLHNLKYLDLTGNKLKIFNIVWNNCPNLETLILKKNGLQNELGACLSVQYGIPRIKYLDVSENGLTYIRTLPESVITLVCHTNKIMSCTIISDNLKILDIHSNAVNHIMLNCIDLEHVDLRDNTDLYNNSKLPSGITIKNNVRKCRLIVDENKLSSFHNNRFKIDLDTVDVVCTDNESSDDSMEVHGSDSNSDADSDNTDYYQDDYAADDDSYDAFKDFDDDIKILEKGHKLKKNNQEQRPPTPIYIQNYENNEIDQIDQIDQMFPNFFGFPEIFKNNNLTEENLQQYGKKEGQNQSINDGGDKENINLYNDSIDDEFNNEKYDYSYNDPHINYSNCKTNDYLNNRRRYNHETQTWEILKDDDCQDLFYGSANTPKINYYTDTWKGKVWDYKTNSWKPVDRQNTSWQNNNWQNTSWYNNNNSFENLKKKYVIAEAKLYIQIKIDECNKHLSSLLDPKTIILENVVTV